MDLLSQILRQLGGVASIAVVVICGILIVCRQTLVEWLRRRVTRELDVAAEHHKHELLLQSESFKAELVRTQDIERYKFEIRKVIAEKMLEKRVAAVEHYFSILNEIPSRILANLACARQIRENAQTAYASIRDMQAAQYSHGLAVSMQFRTQWMSIVDKLQRLVMVRWEQPEALPTDAPEYLEILQLCAGLSNSLEAMVAALPTEFANAIVAPPAAG